MKAYRGSRWGGAAALALMCSLAAPAAASQPIEPNGGLHVPPIEFSARTLRNGLRVYSLPDRSTSNVSVSLWFEIGSKHDPDARSGFAHLFEHLLFGPTQNIPPDRLLKLTEDVGGSREASNWYDRTTYTETVPAEFLESILWSQAERLARPLLDPAVFDKERNVVKEELRQRVLSAPYGRLVRFVLPENSFDTMPHRRPGIGSLADLDAATADEVLAFHEAYYGPDTAALIVSGNFDQRQLDAWVETYFAAVPRRAHPLPIKIQAADPPRKQPRVVTAYAPGVPQPAVVSSWQVPPVSHADMPAIEVLDAILVQGSNARLKRVLIQEGQVAASAETHFEKGEDAGFYAIQAIVAGGKSAGEAQAAIAAEIGRLRDAPVSDGELSEAKNEILAASLRLRETARGRAAEFGEALIRTGDPASADRRLKAVLAVTAADVQRVARRYLSAVSRVDINYLDESARPAGQADAAANPLPMPKFVSLGPPRRKPLQPAPDAMRRQPPAPAAAPQVNSPQVEESRLANGLRLVTARTTAVPIATLTLAVDGGIAAEPSAKAGLATILANLLSAGSSVSSGREIAGRLEALGATLTASAGADGTIVSLTAPAANIEPAGAILAEIVRNPAFPEAEVRRAAAHAKDRVAAALKSTAQLAGLVAPPLLFGAAPYGKVPGGTADSLASLSRADLLEHHRSWWRPERTTLVVTGSVEPQTAKSLAQKVFGMWQGVGVAAPLAAASPLTVQPPRTLVIDVKGATQTLVAAVAAAPPRSDPTYGSVMAANAVLGSGTGGRLFQELRARKGLTYGSFSSLDPRRGASMLSAWAKTQNENAAEVAELMLREIGRLGAEPLDADLLERRKAFVLGFIGRQLETSEGYGAAMANAVLQGLPATHASRLQEELSGVSPGAVAEVAERFVTPARAHLIVVGDASKFMEKLRVMRPGLELQKAETLDWNALYAAGASADR